MDALSGYVAQLEVLEDIPTQWELLFAAVKSVNQEIRINNIDHRLAHKIRMVKAFGLENTIDQYEMELKL